MMRMLEHEAPAELHKIGVTIRKWFLPIIRMWRYSKNWNHERVPPQDEAHPEERLRVLER